MNTTERKPVSRCDDSSPNSSGDGAEQLARRPAKRRKVAVVKKQRATTIRITARPQLRLPTPPDNASEIDDSCSPEPRSPAASRGDGVSGSESGAAHHPPCRPVRAFSDDEGALSAVRTPDEGSAESEDGRNTSTRDRDQADLSRADLTWQDHEITGMVPDPSDPDDTHGLDGVGFRREGVAEAVLAAKKKQQILQYERREQAEARERRLQLRRGRSAGSQQTLEASSAGDSSCLSAGSKKRVRFTDSDLPGSR
ncbi:hypothetical protein KEM52_003899 [Ascosphaera acerosa]|nr:hypothetical protein KEM52_003899 [Ascosphaera acerosa]